MFKREVGKEKEYLKDNFLGPENWVSEGFRLKMTDV